MTKFETIRDALLPTPRGIEVRTGLAGRLSWRLERDGRVIAEGQQRNLITDAGMDAWADCDQTGGSFDSINNITREFRGTAMVGTGSTTPAVSDTSLDAQVKAVTEPGNAKDAITSQGINAGAEVFDLERDYVFDFAASYNLTEWGLRPEAGGSLSVRSLFYEADGTTPKTISVQANDRLTLVHTIELTASPVGANVAATWTVTEYDRQGTDLGDTVLSGWMSLTGEDVGARCLQAIPTGGGSTSEEFSTLSSAETQCDINRKGDLGTTIAHAIDAYTPGTHQRVRRYQLTADELNSVWHGWAAGVDQYSSSDGGTVMFVFDGTTWEKANTHTAEIIITNSWSRT